MTFVAEWPAAEDVEDLVALVVAGCPVDGQQRQRLAVQSELFVYLAAAGCGRRLTYVDVTAGNTPLVAVRLADQKIAVNEQGAPAATRGVANRSA